MGEKNLVRFECRVIRDRYMSNDFKIYLVDVRSSIHPDINKNDSGEYIIVGNFHSLVAGTTYSVMAEEEKSKYGYQYKVKTISGVKPKGEKESKRFLRQILTEQQTNVIMDIYPDIIDRVISNNLDDVDLNLLKGIKEKTFEKIKDNIINNFALFDIVSLFGDSISMKNAKKLYELYPSIEKIKAKLQEDPYRVMCLLDRIGFKTADDIILKMEKENILNFKDPLISSKGRMYASVRFVLDENESNGNTRISISDLREKCGELSPECMNHFIDVVRGKDKYITVVDKLKSVSTTRAFETEKYIGKTIMEAVNIGSKWSINPEPYRYQTDGINITDEQMQTLYSVCNNNVTLLTASGGCGKSASVASLINMLKDNNKSYALMTPTGKSAEVLAEYTGEDAGTIHRKLGYNPKLGWEFNADNKLDVDVVIVDEFSMVDIYLMQHFLDAIDVSKTKIVLVFDSYQLASVGCGNIAHDLLSSKLIPTALLTKVFRYNEGGLMQVATKVRNGESFLDNNFKGNKIFGKNKDFIYMEMDQGKMISKTVNLYKKLISDGYNLEDIMVLTSQNKGDYGTTAVNKAIQNEIQKEGKNKFIQRGFTRFYEGDKVIQTQNNYQAKDIEGNEGEQIYNGNTGIVSIVNTYDGSLIVDFKDKQILYEKDDLEKLELGYCITSHKSQGSGCKQVIILAPKAHTFMLNSNLLYVALTRTKERCYMMGNILTINRAVKKKENLQRNTWLEDMLKSLKNITK